MPFRCLAYISLCKVECGKLRVQFQPLSGAGFTLPFAGLWEMGETLPLELSGFLLPGFGLVSEAVCQAPTHAAAVTPGMPLLAWEQPSPWQGQEGTGQDRSHRGCLARGCQGSAACGHAPRSSCHPPAQLAPSNLPCLTAWVALCS